MRIPGYRGPEESIPHSLNEQLSSGGHLKTLIEQMGDYSDYDIGVRNSNDLIGLETTKKQTDKIIKLLNEFLNCSENGHLRRESIATDIKEIFDQLKKKRNETTLH